MAAVITCFAPSPPRRFDLPRFYREVRRILKPSGCFAAWTYGLPVLHSQEHPANAVLWQLYDGVLGPYWAAGRRHVEDTYATVQPVQGQDFGRVQLLQKAFAATRRAKVDDVVSLWLVGWVGWALRQCSCLKCVCVTPA